jgi:chromosome partitioning protein
MAMMEQIRSAMLAPSARKSAPVFNLSQLAALLRRGEGVGLPPHGQG